MPAPTRLCLAVNVAPKLPPAAPGEQLSRAARNRSRRPATVRWYPEPYENIFAIRIRPTPWPWQFKHRSVRSAIMRALIAGRADFNLHEAVEASLRRRARAASLP